MEFSGSKMMKPGKCPHCGTEVDAAICLQGEFTPSPGDRSVMFCCGNIGIYTETLDVRKATDAERDDAIKTLPDIRKALEAWKSMQTPDGRVLATKMYLDKIRALSRKARQFIVDNPESDAQIKWLQRDKTLVVGTTQDMINHDLVTINDEGRRLLEAMGAFSGSDFDIPTANMVRAALEYMEDIRKEDESADIRT